MDNHSPWLILPVAILLLMSACSSDTDDAGDVTEAAQDITPEMEAFYAANPEFFSFRTIADLPANLEWETGMDLPDLGSPEARKGGTMNYFIGDFPRTLRVVGPDSNGSFRGWVHDMIGLPLAAAHPVDDSRYFPGLAQAWATDDAEPTVYMKLDPDARWSDGEPVTADDYIFMFFFYQSEYIVAPWYNNYYGTQYSNITKYDEYTISITAAVRKPHFQDNVLGLAPVPRHFFNELGPDYVERYQWRFVPTTGAYEVRDEDVRKGRSMTLTRIRDWWAKDKRYYRNRFNPDKIRLSVIRDTSKSFEVFMRGEIDILRLNTSDLWYEKLPDTHPDVRNGYIHKVTFYNDKPRPTYGLWMNSTKGHLANQDVRLGIQFASNWGTVIDKFFRGDYARMRTTADGYGEVTHPTIRARPFDIQQAQEYFAMAGFVERGPDGILVNENGERLSFTLTTGYDTLADVLTILKEEALKAGLEFRVEVLDQTASFKKAQEKKHDVLLVAFNVGGRYPVYWETYHSVNAYDDAFLEDGSINPDRKPKTQTNNLEGVAIRELDDMIERYRKVESEEDLISIAHGMEELLHDYASFVPGFIQGYERSAHWRWVRWPDDFNIKDAGYVYEYMVHWIDEDLRTETQNAIKQGEIFPPVITVYDQYKVD